MRAQTHTLSQTYTHTRIEFLPPSPYSHTHTCTCMHTHTNREGLAYPATYTQDKCNKRACKHTRSIPATKTLATERDDNATFSACHTLVPLSLSRRLFFDDSFYTHTQTLANLEDIKKRNRPLEAPTAPAEAPFFLPTLPGLEPVFAPEAVRPVFDFYFYTCVHM